jgi:hypothetical protein
MIHLEAQILPDRVEEVWSIIKDVVFFFQVVEYDGEETF